jgi:cell division protein FtsL
MKQLKRKLTRSEKLLLVLLAIALIAVAIKWNTVKEGFVQGWKAFDIEKWYQRD